MRFNFKTACTTKSLHTIVNPCEGDLIYVTDANAMYVYAGDWIEINTSNSDPHKESTKTLYPHVCKCCGAPMRSNVCEYCGVEEIEY